MRKATRSCPVRPSLQKQTGLAASSTLMRSLLLPFPLLPAWTILTAKPLFENCMGQGRKASGVRGVSGPSAWEKLWTSLLR